MTADQRKILVLAVHPDDETLGAGGTLLAQKAAGAELGWLVLTHMSSQQGWAQERIQERDAEIAAVRRRYGFDFYDNLGFPPASLDTVPLGELITQIRAALETFQPDTVILPFWDDAHSDHKVAFRAASACLKRFRAPWVRRLYTMEVISETNFSFPTQFRPRVYADITGYMDQKIEIAGLYASELGQHPFPRSVESLRALGILRGAEAGVTHAEAFELINTYDGI